MRLKYTLSIEAEKKEKKKWKIPLYPGKISSNLIYGIMFVSTNSTHEVKFYYNISEMKLQKLLRIILEREITYRLITRTNETFHL